MALAPLPTSKMEAKDHKAAALPYPAFEAGKSLMQQPSKRVMNPLHQSSPSLQTEQITAAVSPAVAQPSTEEMRMKELENMLNEAQSRTAVVEQEAYDKAYAAGEKAGLALGEKRAEQMLEALENIVVQAEKQLQQLQHDSGHAVLDIAQAITEHVIGEFGDEVESALSKAASQAVEQFSAEHTDLTGLVLAVHPNDLDVMTRMCSVHPEWRIRADKSIASGTCRLLSAHQDAFVDPKQAIEKAVLHIQGQLLSHHG
ncbi:MAG: FliH/SctL family protein [Ghiorsea sp.]